MAKFTSVHNHDSIKALLPTHSDKEIAEAVGCSTRTVARLRKDSEHTRKRTPVDWSQYDHLLGTMSDAELGRMIGRTTAAVFQRRMKLNIKTKQRKDQIDWTKFDCMLGMMPDLELANLIGCTPPSVRARRLKLKIAVYEDPTRFKWNIPQKK